MAHFAGQGNTPTPGFERCGAKLNENAVIERTRIKICGLTDPDMAVRAAQAGADAIGLVSHMSSPRHVAPTQAAQIASALPAFVSVVALFVDADPQFVRDFIAVVKPDVLQFHGEESPTYCRQFGHPYIKAMRMQAGVDLVQYAIQYADAKGLLLDAWVPGMAGGTGAMFDWSLIPTNIALPVILSGGLDANNVGAAIRQVRPWAVDVSSGVERVKGVKDAMKIAQFIIEVQHAQK